MLDDDITAIVYAKLRVRSDLRARPRSRVNVPRR